MSELIEAVARAICPNFGCVNAKFIKKPCVDEKGFIRPYQSTVDRLALTPVWAAAESAVRAVRKWETEHGK